MNNNIFRYATVEELKIYMSQKGWRSKDQVSNLGWGDGDKYGYSIWFERWDWHGKNGADVCFHAHTGDLSKIHDVVEKAALMALKAWEEYQDCVPSQCLDGVKKDEIKTKILYNN
jgi:hypothetical protein